MSAGADSTCVKCTVSGKVQGVWFRGNTQAQAQNLGITGYARNLRDGSVEVLACGQPQNVQALKDWLWRGPPAAKVTDVQCQTVAVDPPEAFTVG